MESVQGFAPKQLVAFLAAVAVRHVPFRETVSGFM